MKGRYLLSFYDFERDDMGDLIDYLGNMHNPKTENITQTFTLIYNREI